MVVDTRQQNGAQTGSSLFLSVPSSWPPCSSCWWCQWWRLRHRSATPSGAIDTTNTTWTISGRGRIPYPKIARRSLGVSAGDRAQQRADSTACEGAVIGDQSCDPYSQPMSHRYLLVVQDLVSFLGSGPRALQRAGQPISAGAGHSSRRCVTVSACAGWGMLHGSGRDQCGVHTA